MGRAPSARCAYAATATRLRAATHHHQQQANPVEHLLGAGHVNAGTNERRVERLREAGQEEAPTKGPNSVPMPPMIGPRTISIERKMLKTWSGNRLL